MNMYFQLLSQHIEMHLTSYLTALVLFLFIVLVRRFVVNGILWSVNKLLVGLKEETRETVRAAFEKPLRIMVVFIALYVAILQLPFDMGADSLTSRLFRTLFIVTFAYGTYYMDQIITLGMSRIRQRINLQSSEILKKFLIRTYHVVIIVVAITMVADQFGINVNSIIAGFGIAGLAVALAAQETLANIFGGITIIFDKPFDVGDLISAAGIDGVVEDINFRTTRIRMLTKELVSIPNSKVANSAITNLTRRDQRRVKMILGATYGAKKHQIKSVVDEIEAMLIDMKLVDNESIFVRFDGFGATSKDIYVQFLTLTGDWGEYLTIKQDACYGMMDIFEKHGVEFAFPSQSIYFENELLMKNPHSAS